MERGIAGGNDPGAGGGALQSDITKYWGAMTPERGAGHYEVMGAITK